MRLDEPKVTTEALALSSSAASSMGGAGPALGGIAGPSAQHPVVGGGCKGREAPGAGQVEEDEEAPTSAASSAAPAATEAAAADAPASVTATMRKEVSRASLGPDGTIGSDQDARESPPPKKARRELGDEPSVQKAVWSVDHLPQSEVHGLGPSARTQLTSERQGAAVATHTAPGTAFRARVARPQATAEEQSPHAQPQSCQSDPTAAMGAAAAATSVGRPSMTQAALPTSPFRTPAHVFGRPAEAPGHQQYASWMRWRAALLAAQSGWPGAPAGMHGVHGVTGSHPSARVPFAAAPAVAAKEEQSEGVGLPTSQRSPAPWMSMAGGDAAAAAGSRGAGTLQSDVSGWAAEGRPPPLEDGAPQQKPDRQAYAFSGVAAAHQQRLRAMSGWDPTAAAAMPPPAPRSFPPPEQDRVSDYHQIGGPWSPFAIGAAGASQQVPSHPHAFRAAAAAAAAAAADSEAQRRELEAEAGPQFAPHPYAMGIPPQMWAPPYLAPMWNPMMAAAAAAAGMAPFAAYFGQSGGLEARAEQAQQLAAMQAMHAARAQAPPQPPMPQDPQAGVVFSSFPQGMAHPAAAASRTHDAETEDRKPSLTMMEHAAAATSAAAAPASVDTARPLPPTGSRTSKVPPKGHLCPYPGCGKRFTYRQDLVRHYRIHTGDRPYKCLEPGCGKAFLYPNDLKRHTRTHTGERPFKCPTCGKRFKQRSHVTSHLKTHQKDRGRDASAADPAYR